MYAKIVKILIIFLFCCLLSGCSHDKGIILFNSAPIRHDNILNNQNIFPVGAKIYYIFIAPKKLDSEYIRVQVFTLTDKYALGGEDMVRRNDFRLMHDERYYFTDYFTFWDKGRYVMQVFSHDDLTTPLAISEFYVK